MSQTRALQIVLGISLFGALFSGTLVVREFCGPGGGSCTNAGGSGTIFGYPPCVYGLMMYLLLVAVSALGLRQGSGGAKGSQGQA